MAKNVISSAKALLTAYRKALVRLEDGLGEEFAKAVNLMQGSDGHVVVCGMGKSGIIGRKISSSLASTGTPSLFLHPAEATSWRSWHGPARRYCTADFLFWFH